MVPETTGRINRLANLWSRNERAARFAALAAGVGLVAVIWFFRNSFASLKVVGYPGVLFFSFLASSAMVLPLPGILSVCAVGALLNPIVVGVLGGIGETAGEITGYAVGYGGRGVFEKRRFFTRVNEWMERRGTLILFLFSVIPNPFFDVVGVAAGATGFSLTRFLGTVLVGKTIKSLAIAIGCAEGLRLLTSGAQ